MNVPMDLAGFALVGAAVAVVVYQLGRVPAPPAPTLGMRGLRRSESLARLSSLRALDPVLRKVAGWISLLPLAKVRARAAVLLHLSGDCLGLSPDEWIALCTLSGAVGLAAGAYAVGSANLPPVFATMVGVLAAAVPYTQIKGIAVQRRGEIEKTLPSAIDLIGLCVSAGLTFPQAVEDIIDRWPNPREPMVEEMRLILREIGLGHSRAEALTNFGKRVPCETVSDFVAAVVQSELKGTSLKDVLATQAVLLRNKRTVMSEEGAAKAAVKMVMPMTCLLFAILMVIGGPLMIKTMRDL